ncbi:MAG: carboxyl transferase domain-containing protein, partial [Burkholderiaceae bacterium]
RVDSMGYAGYCPSPSFDSLLAKLIVHHQSADYASVVRKARRALDEFRIEGLETNLGFQRALMADPAVQANQVDTGFVEGNIARLVGAISDSTRFFVGAPDLARSAGSAAFQLPTGSVPATAGMLGSLVAILVEEGSMVAEGGPVAVVDAMKMEHAIVAPVAGRVVSVFAQVGEAVQPDQPLIAIEPGTFDGLESIAASAEIELDAVRPDLERLNARLLKTVDAGRPQAVAKRHATGNRTTRENIEDLIDAGSLIEYGALGIAPQRARHSHDHLLHISPADGVITGLASINGDIFEPSQSRAAVLSYDWTVFGGTQGVLGHKKKDRLFKVVRELEVPLVLFTEGGGGRPGDTEFIGPAGLDLMTFAYMAHLSGLVPLVGITNRFCFAGNAALLAVCDVIIATEGSNIGMGGPAMIEGGGLGKFEAREIGPSDVQSRNGVIDILVKDEEEAVATAKKYLAYFQGPIKKWACADQRVLRHLVPVDRLRSYEIRPVIEAIADTGSVLEIRRAFGIGMVTALARIEGRSVGIIANNSRHLGGAVDADAADKGARFMQLCDAFDIPIVFLCDTPGFMVGPEAEKQAQVRHFGRLFVTGANVSVPSFTFVLRKGYGLGALGSTGGGFHAPKFIVAWPSAEFGGMGLEGHVRLAFAKELAAIEDETERQKEYQRLVDDLYKKGSAIGMAEDFEIDAVIDPIETRRWILRGLDSLPPQPPRRGKRRPNIDTW